MKYLNFIKQALLLIPLVPAAVQAIKKTVEIFKKKPKELDPPKADKDKENA